MTKFSSAPVWTASTVTLGKMVQPNLECKDDVLSSYVYAGKIGTNGSLNENSESREMWFNPSELRRLSLCEGDTLVTEGGDVGRPAFIAGDLPGVGFQNSVVRLRPLRRVLLALLAHNEHPLLRTQHPYKLGVH